MPTVKKSENISLIQFVVEEFNPSVDTPVTGFARVGVDVTGVYWVYEDGVVNRGSGGGGGAEELTDLSDVSAAAQTANFVLAAGDGSTGGDYRGRALVADDIPTLTSDHIPQLLPTKIDFIGVSATASGLIIDTELTDVDVDTLVAEYDTDSILQGDNETFTIPNDMAGYYEGMIRLFITTVNSVTTPLIFYVDVYKNGVFSDRFTANCFQLQPNQHFWAYILPYIVNDDITLKVSKEGGTALAEDEVSVTFTLSYRGSP